MINFRPVKNALLGYDSKGDKVAKSIVGNPNTKLVKKMLRTQYRIMVRNARLAKFKKMADDWVGHRIDVNGGKK